MTAPRPSLRLKKKRFRKSPKTRPPFFSSSKSGAENCCVVTRPDRVRDDVDEEVDPELLDGAAVDLRDADLQHDLLALRAAGQLQQVDDAGLARHPLCDFARAQHDGVARHMARQDDALVVHRNLKVLAWKELLERLLERRHAGIDHDVVLTALVSAPDDQADRSGALAVDQHLARLNDGCIGNSRIRDGDARDVEWRVEHRRTAGRQDHPLETAGVGRLRGGSISLLRRNRRHHEAHKRRLKGPTRNGTRNTNKQTHFTDSSVRLAARMASTV